MIRFTGNGNYGHRPDESKKLVKLITYGDVFSADAEEEERLVNLGIAEYVNEEGAAVSAALESEELSINDLRKKAKELGLNAGGTKADLIARVEEAEAEEEEVAEEEPPVLSAAEPE